MIGDEFIQFAGKLAAFSPPSEPALRSAVSRAYYGAYHTALELLEKASIQDKSRNHGKNVQKLQNSGNIICKTAGDLLSDFQSQRVKADYELQSAGFGTPTLAFRAVEVAAKIRDLLSQCHDERTLAEVKAGIAAYMKKTRGPR
jgi:uncharacterized protein (UPF0332 family)